MAAVRPAFASPGNTITLFDPALVDGVQYDVEIGAGAESVTLQATAATRRDCADAVYKPRLEVVAPEMALGPTQIVVRLGANTVMTVPDTDFTMLPPPVVLPAGNALVRITHYQGARGADGTLYLPLDLTAITARTVFTGLGKSGFRFLFDAQHVAIYNVQGILMELLASSTAPHQIDDGENDDDDDDPDEAGAASSRLVYDRHEFATYRRRHVTEADWLLDVDDLAWHADGSRHIDHDHLVLAIGGTLNGGGHAGPGATSPFTLKIAKIEPDEATSPTVNARIAWNDQASVTSTTQTSTTTTTTGTLDGGTTTTVTASTTTTTQPSATCHSDTPGVQLACVCEGESLPACASEVMPRAVALPFRAACRLLARSVDQDGDVLAYVYGRIALQLERARTALDRNRVARRLSPECRAALAAALQFDVP